MEGSRFQQQTMPSILHRVLWLPKTKEVRETHYSLEAMELTEVLTLPITITWLSPGKILKNQLNQANLEMVVLTTMRTTTRLCTTNKCFFNNQKTLGVVVLLTK